MHERTATSDVTLKSPKIESGRVVELCCATIIDLDTAAKKCRLGYFDGAKDIWILRRTLGTNVHALYLRGHLTLIGGQHLIGMVESPSDKDDVYLLATGYYKDV